MRTLGRAAPAAALAGALALAYLWPFRAYGINVEDEGTLMSQIARFGRGELPYVDFATGYTPGFFAVCAWLWRRTGDLVTFHTWLAALHAMTIAGMALLLARLGRLSLAIVAPLLLLAFVPVYPGEFCAFNVPYPAWFATLGWIATAGCMQAFVGRRQRAWLVLAGLVAALTLAVKPNAGVFAIAACAAVLLLVREDGWRGGVLAAAAWIGLWVGILGGVWIVFGLTLDRTDTAVYLLPLLGAMAALVTRSRVGRAFLVGDLAALLVPFAVVSVPWLLYFRVRLGPAAFLRDVLFVGSGAADLYYVSYPPFEPWALVVTGLAVGFAVGGWFVAQGRLPPGPTAIVLGACLVVTLAAVRGIGLMPEGPIWSIIWQLQSAAFALTLATHVAGVVWLWFRGRRPANAGAAVVLLFALFMHLQLYPRADFMHLLSAAPLSLVFAGYLLDRALDSWERGFAARGASVPRRLVGTLMTGLIVAAIGVAVTPGLTAVRLPDRFVLPFPVAPVGVEHTSAADLRDLAAATTRLGGLVRPGGESLAFPAASLALFLTGARNPGPHDYFFAGRPDHREEAEILDRLAVHPPAAVLSLNRRFTFFDEASTYYFLLRRFIRERYVLAGRHGRYDVLEARPPRAPAAPAPAAVPADAAFASAATVLAGRTPLAERLAAVAILARAPVETAAPSLLQAASGDSAVLRQAALAALLDLLERFPAYGLERYVRASGLDRASEVRLLRTVRDLRDPRAASYLFAAIRSGDSRLVTDALGAMHVTRNQMVARRNLWAGAEEVQVWPARDAVLEAVRAVLADPLAHPRAVTFAAHLAGVLRDAGSVPALRDRWRAETPAPGAPAADSMLPPSGPAATASVAAALAELAPQGIACELVALLTPVYAPLRELVPTTILGLATSEEPVRSEALRCLAAVLAVPGPAQAEAVWIAAVLDDPALAAGVHAALGSFDPAARRAAAWALGEIAGPPGAALALEQSARADVDPIVRRFAADALAKRAGRAPRVFPRTPPVARAAGAPVVR